MYQVHLAIDENSADRRHWLYAKPKPYDRGAGQWCFPGSI